MEKDLAVPIDERHLYKGISLSTPLKEIECTCRGDEQVACKQILPTAHNTTDVIVYNSCKRTLFAALKRQLRKTPPPAPDITRELHEFMREYFNTYLEPILREFDYSYTKWFNSMPRPKQDDINRQSKQPNDLIDNTYGMFCKREKQEFGGKNRAISNVSQATKFVLGPVTWELEAIFDKHAPGYCGTMNWNQLEDFYTQAYHDGYIYAIQGDGSAFDLSQSFDLKYIDRLVYNYLVDKGFIYHVEGQVFRKLATARFRNLKASYSVKGKMYTLGTAKVDGTVFSGSPDTTLFNTLRMIIYNMFTLHKAGMKYKEDYLIKCKGDDFLILARSMRDYQAIYDKYWIKPIADPLSYTYEPYGIGQVLKFLLVGDFSTLDFCSTTVIPYDNGTRFKIARKPTRMDPLSHYSTAALSMSLPMYKQYLIDLADSIDQSMGNMPFYRSYAKAYRYQASLIDGVPIRSSTGRPRLKLPFDGHHSQRNTDDDELTWKYRDYGRDFVEGMKTRKSEHSIPDDDVYHHLLHMYHITRTDIELHERFLMFDGMYDHVASNFAS